MKIAGTGHRPDKLGGYGDNAFAKLVALATWALNHADATHVISGGALGWDQALAAAAFSLGIPFTIAMPFNGQESKWPQDSQMRFRRMCQSAEKIHVVCEGGYSPHKMQVRNEWMVNNADSVLALWNGTPGGTANCVKYAEMRGRPIINVYPQYRELRDKD